MRRLAGVVFSPAPKKKLVWGASLDADHPFTRQVVLGYMVPVADTMSDLTHIANGTSSKSSFIWGSDYFDFEASMEGEHDKRDYESVGEIRPWKFKPPGRT